MNRLDTKKAAHAIAGDPWILLSALFLAGFGLVMVYSAGSALGAKLHGDSAYFFKHQLVHLAAGLAVMVFLATRDYAWLERMAYPALLLAFVALLLTFIPGIGHTAGGATRWIRILGTSAQPAELAKLALVLTLAYSLANHQHQIKSFSRGFLPHMMVAGGLVLLILMQPDLGMSLTIMGITLVMLFVAGTRFTYLFGLLALFAPVVYLLITRVEYRWKRWVSFLDPWADPLNTGFQIIHSFLAFGSGGLWGSGLGASKQKLFYLPEPHTDFVFSVLGEEMGLIGVWAVLILFMLLIWRGVRASLDARDLFGTYLALGCTLIIGLQAFVNMAVVMGLLPTKGLTLPFISYGGTSLLVSFVCVGILLSVAGHKEKSK